MRTVTEKLARAERWRIRKGSEASDKTDGWNGLFVVPIDGELWQVWISDADGWRHLFATNLKKDLLPDWHVMCLLREYFFADESWVLQFYPPADCADNHPFVHLWESLEEKQPIPPCVLIG